VGSLRERIGAGTEEMRVRGGTENVVKVLESCDTVGGGGELGRSEIGAMSELIPEYSHVPPD
jgi:hypothetical protein